MGFALGIAGAVIAAYGAREQGQYQKAAAKTNEKIANQAAGDARLRGQAEEAQIRMRARKLAGAQRAAFGAIGADPGIGAPTEVLADTAFMAEYDALLARSNAQREAWGLEAQASVFRTEAKLATSSSYYAAGGSLLSGASTAAYMKGK